MKILFLILDGLGDRPIKELGNKTPLEAAGTPNLDFLTSQGICGLLEPTYKEKFPTSIEGHLSLFGYDIKKLETNQGIFEAAGTGMRVKKGDVALRGNFATVGRDLKIIDRRAGRIQDTSKLVSALQGITIKGVKFIIKGSISHRVVVVMRGQRVSDKITAGDFHKVGIKAPKVLPKNKSRAARFTADVLNEFLQKSHQILKNHPLNKQRLKKGLLPANYILVRGASMLKPIPSFEKKWGLKACYIAGGKLYKGIGKILKMDEIKVKGATGRADTNLEGKFEAAKKCLKKYDFCYCHIKATDNFSHDGDCQGKKEMLEKIDRALGTVALRHEKPKDLFIVITGDHSTPCKVGEHTADPLPVLVCPLNLTKFCLAKLGQVKHFSEKACKKGGLGKIKSNQLLQKILQVAKMEAS